MDISRGLPAEVEILCNERLLIQRLDYLHVPFKCSCCRSVGHLRNSCPHRFSGGNNSYFGELRSPSLSASPSEGQHTPPGISNESTPLNDFVPDSFLEAVDNLILSHKKPAFPQSSSFTDLDPPPRASPRASFPPSLSVSTPFLDSSPKEREAPSLLPSSDNSLSPLLI